MTWRASAGAAHAGDPAFHRCDAGSPTLAQAQQSAGQIADGKVLPLFVEHWSTHETWHRPIGGAWRQTAEAR